MVHYDSIEQFKKAIFKAWEEIPIEYFQNLIKSMQNRINACIRNGGAHIDY